LLQHGEAAGVLVGAAVAAFERGLRVLRQMVPYPSAEGRLVTIAAVAKTQSLWLALKTDLK
jgi:hypothetical protein